jgi:hypothetical protein
MNTKESLKGRHEHHILCAICAEYELYQMKAKIPIGIQDKIPTEWQQAQEAFPSR